MTGRKDHRARRYRGAIRITRGWHGRQSRGNHIGLAKKDQPRPFQKTVSAPPTALPCVSMSLDDDQARCLDSAGNILLMHGYDPSQKRSSVRLIRPGLHG